MKKQKLNICLIIAYSTFSLSTLINHITKLPAPVMCLLTGISFSFFIIGILSATGKLEKTRAFKLKLLKKNPYFYDN